MACVLLELPRSIRRTEMTWRCRYPRSYDDIAQGCRMDHRLFDDLRVLTEELIEVFQAPTMLTTPL